MSAMVLRTGSKTRKLTDSELIRLACWHWRQAAICRQWEEAWADGYAGPELGEGDGAATTIIDGDALERTLTEFLSLPREQKAFYITVAETNHFTVCGIFGDHVRAIAEPAPEGGHP